MLKYLSIITILILSSVMNLYAQNYALDLDGINDYVSTPIDADLQAMPSTTWSGWIKPTGVSGWQIIFGMEDGGWDRMLTIENGGLGLSMGHTTNRWQTGASVNPGVWQHVVAVYDNGSMKFYLNGVQYTSSTSEGSHSSSGTFTIGANQNGGGNFYKGLIDDVALWNEALTAAEITALYNAGSGLNAAVNSGNYTSSSNLLGYWRMNEGTGSTLTDGSGNSNSGTLVNMDINDWVLNLPLVSKYGSFSNTNYNYVDKNGKEGGMDGIDKRGEIITVIPLQNSLRLSASTSDYLSFTKPSGFNSSADFTFETWIKFSNLSGSPMEAAIFGGGQADYISVYGGYFAARINVNNPCGGDRNFFSSSLISLNTWHHIALVRSGSTITGYLNGVSRGTTSCTGTFMNSLGTILIGKNTWRAGFLSADISNMRYVVGTAVYTSNFTPPTSVLTAITGTQFLLKANNVNNPLEDSSINNITISSSGSPTLIIANGPF